MIRTSVFIVINRPVSSGSKLLQGKGFGRGGSKFIVSMFPGHNFRARIIYVVEWCPFYSTALIITHRASDKSEKKGNIYTLSDSVASLPKRGERTREPEDFQGSLSISTTTTYPFFKYCSIHPLRLGVPGRCSTCSIYDSKFTGNSIFIMCLEYGGPEEEEEEEKPSRKW